MRKYQTRTQVALNFLLSEAREELRLCEDRIEYLTKHRDYVHMKIEKQVKANLNEKIEKISSLIDMENESSSYLPSLLQIQILDTKGETIIQEEHLSEVIE
ncbi:hypothetical protein [Bacillus sp. XT-2]|uniref:hypothetical protein n=1 Tax=Bacillus sp. XT-2 TaxID=2856852 RepID=UPI0021E132F5|nr:hypothetical protein [Bacillus sp. XT-2]MCV0023440.1 hypothetical protein [Bacillus sp. XT-2]MCV0025727.1 hypothetical protein [Bacillus sp. XT-2]